MKYLVIALLLTIARGLVRQAARAWGEVFWVEEVYELADAIDEFRQIALNMRGDE